MAALVATTPTKDGVTVAGAAIAASDTVSASILGTRGALLELTNGSGSTNNVTISDDSDTSTGADATDVATTIANGASKVFKLLPAMANPSTRVITITNSQTATSTYKLYPLG